MVHLSGAERTTRVSVHLYFAVICTDGIDSNKKFDEFLKSRNPEVSLFFCLFQRMGGENHFLVWFKGYR